MYTNWYIKELSQSWAEEKQMIKSEHQVYFLGEESWKWGNKDIWKIQEGITSLSLKKSWGRQNLGDEQNLINNILINNMLFLNAPITFARNQWQTNSADLQCKWAT